MSDTSQQAIIQALPGSPLEAPPASAWSDLHDQLRALRAAWIFQGIVGLGASLLFAGTDAVGPALLAGLLGACWMTFGIGASARKLWSVQGGLFVGYVTLACGVLSWLGAVANPRSHGSSALFWVLFQLLVVRAARLVVRCHRQLGARSPLT